MRRDVDASDGDDGVVLDQGAQRCGGGRIGKECGQCRCGQRGRLEQGLGQAGVAGLLEYADEVDVVQAETTRGLGHDERRRAQLGQHGPAIRRLLGAAGVVGEGKGPQ